MVLVLLLWGICLLKSQEGGREDHRAIAFEKIANMGGGRAALSDRFGSHGFEFDPKDANTELKSKHGHGLCNCFS